MSYIGVDFGTKRIGIAVSDDDGRLAFPHKVISSDARASAKVAALARERGVEDIVLGESRMLSGEANPVMEHIVSFKKQLEEAGLMVHLEPEYMTTAAASRTTRDKRGAATAPRKDLDASAAALILQSFLDKKNR